MYLMKALRAVPLPLFVLVAAVIALCHSMIGGALFWGLPSLQFYPWRDLALEQLRAGSLPLWNPYNGAGAPLLANYQTALFYPLNWPQFVLPLELAMGWTAALHLLIGGWGMWRLLGALGADALGRGLAALGYGLCGYIVARLGTFPTVSAAAWLPWIVWAVHRLVGDEDARAGWKLTLFTALLLLAGHAQTAWYSLLLTGFYALWLGVKGGRGGIARVFAAGVWVALGVGVAAVQLMPTVELLLHSQRNGGLSHDFAMNFSFHPVRALTWFAPLLFGTPADGSFVTQGAFFEDAVYIGLIPFVSALAAASTWLLNVLRRRSDPQLSSAVFWLAIVIVGFVLALGRYGPVFPFLYESVPTFDLFQAPTRWNLWTIFGLCVLAGMGARLWRLSPRRIFWTRLGLAGAIGIALIGGFAAFALPDLPETMRVLSRGLVWAAVFSALALMLTLLQPAEGGPKRRSWTALVFTLLAADLVVASWGLNPTVSPGFYERRDQETAAVRAYWPRAVEDRVKFDVYLRLDDYRVAVERADEYRVSGLPNLNLIDRAALLNNFDPLLVRYFSDYLDLIELDTESRGPLLRAAGVGAVYDDAGRQSLGAAQRAWVVGALCFHPDEASLKSALLTPDWPPESLAHVLGEGDCASPVSLSGEVALIEERPDRLRFRVRSEAAGWLVVADTYYAGWTAYLDGAPVEILRANLAFRAVPVPAGEHEIEMQLQPTTLITGAGISVLALSIAGVLRLRKRAGS